MSRHVTDDPRDDLYRLSLWMLVSLLLVLLGAAADLQGWFV